MTTTTAPRVPAAPDPLALLHGLADAVSELRTDAPATAARSWAPDLREKIISGIDAAVRDLTVYRGTLLVAHREDGRWGSGGDRDFADWRARTTGTGRGRALGELEIADGLEEMPEVADAVADGSITLEHARCLSRLRSKASTEVRESLEGGTGAELLEKAKKLSAPDFAREAKKVTSSIDAAAAQADAEAVWRRRSVTVSRSGGARTGTWVLDELGGTMMELALDAIVGTPGADDPRTREQRWADALVTMGARTLQAGADLNGAQVRPHLVLIVEQESWVQVRRHREELAAAAERILSDATWPGAALGLGPDGRPATTEDHLQAERRRRADAPGGGTEEPAAGSVLCGTRPVGAPPLPRLPDTAPAELEDGTAIPLGDLARLMCDCEMTRVVMDADSVPLDVGTTQRTYTRELRRAVTTRDRTCQWPGCNIRAAWSEVHHIVWVSRGGRTSAENAMVGCTYHHHVIHRDNVQVVPLPDGFAFYRSDGRLIGTSRRPRRRRDATGTDTRTPASTGSHRGLVEAWEARRPSDRPGAPPTAPRPAAPPRPVRGRPAGSPPPGGGGASRPAAGAHPSAGDGALPPGAGDHPPGNGDVPDGPPF